MDSFLRDFDKCFCDGDDSVLIDDKTLKILGITLPEFKRTLSDHFKKNIDYLDLNELDNDENIRKLIENSITGDKYINTKLNLNLCDIVKRTKSIEELIKLFEKKK